MEKKDMRAHRLVQARFLMLALSALAVLTLIAGIVLMYLNLHSLLVRSENLLRSQAEIIAAETEQLLSADSRMAEILANTDSFRSFAAYTQGGPEQMTRDAYSLCRDMSRMVSAYGVNVNNFAAWFIDSGYVVTMSRWLEKERANLFFDSYPELSEELLLSMPEDSIWYTHFGTAADPHCWTVYRVRLQGETEAYIFVDVNLKSFLQNRLPENGSVYITGESILYSYPGSEIEPEYAALTQAQQSKLLAHGGEKYILGNARTRLNNTVFVALDTRELEGIENMFVLAVCATGLVVFLCIVILSRYMYNRLITPVEALIQTVGHKGGNPESALSSIADSFVTERDANIQMRKEKSHLLPLALGRQLSHLVSISDSDAAVQYAKSCLLLAGIVENEGFLMFAVSCVEDRKNFFKEMNDDPRFRQQGDVFLYLLNNVLTDMLFEKHPGMIAPVRKNWILVLAKKGDASEDTEGMIRELITFFDQSFDAKLVATHAASGDSAEAFIPALLTVSKEISYLDFWGSGREIPQGDETEDEAEFSAYSQRIRMLINRINTEDYDAVPGLIDKIVEEAIPSGVQNIHISKYRLYTMTALIVTALDEQLRDNRDLAVMLNFEERLYKAENIAAFREELRSIFSELVEYRKGQEKLSGSARRMEAARLYIQQHYTENTLTVSTVAERLGISSSYLSREFKESTGMNILEYIQRLRVEAAKPLLLTESVKTTAEKVGFGDAQGLMRAFKKYEGVAPGEYRKISLRESERDTGKPPEKK